MRRRRSDGGPVLAIASGAGLASLSMNFWIPFLPLYMIELGATGHADALVWIGVAVTGQGIARMAAGPIWGALSDRLGRKVMFLRALYFATATTLIAAFATEPWHVAIAFSCQGLFSGFIPAAVALTSVSVPETSLGRSLGTVTAAQYLGTTLGPAIGAVLAIAFGMRGAIIASAALPAIAATIVLFVVPRDEVATAGTADEASMTETSGAAKRPVVRMVSIQFTLAIVVYFVLFATTQLIRLSAPVALSEFVTGDVTAMIGVAFTIAGAASVGGILAARRIARPGRNVVTIALGMGATAVAYVLIGVAPNAELYIAAFSLISLIQAVLLPASNTLIAANAPRARRGTAFGIASSAQALAFIVGPLGAATIAAVSLGGGYLILAAVFAGVTLLVWSSMREPQVSDISS